MNAASCCIITNLRNLKALVDYIMTVEVFRTNVLTATQAGCLLRLMNERFPDYKVYFDLDDCDKVLRVEADEVCVDDVIGLLTERGVACDVLE